MSNNAENASEFVALGQASALSGIPTRSLRRLVQKGALPTYGTLADSRRRYVLKADLDGLTKLSPMPPIRQRRGEEGSTAA